MPLVIDGKKYKIKGLTSGCYLDDPKLGFTDRRDYKPRGNVWVRNICFHTRMGIAPQIIDPNPKNRRWDELVAARMSRNDRRVSWHVSVDADGSFVCHLDVAKHRGNHAGQVNTVSVGIELYQTADGVITEATLETGVLIADALTYHLGIQRQFATEHKIARRFAFPNKSWRKSRKLAYLPGGEQGENFVGVFGHRNATRNRGIGDPGDAIFDYLEEAGYMPFATDTDEDLKFWRQKQKELEIVPDGIPGPNTLGSLERAGYANGQLVSRPLDCAW